MAEDKEDDLILSEGEDSPTTVIDGQLALIATISEFDLKMYDKFEEDSIKCIIRAMAIIYTVQGIMLKRAQLESKILKNL